MAIDTLKKKKCTNQQEYLVSFSRDMMGKALGALRKLGFTREIRCYPNHQILLLEEELKALRDCDVSERAAITL